MKLQKQILFKIDLDMPNKKLVLKHLKDRLLFLLKAKILNYSEIENIMLLKKKSYSVKLLIVSKFEYTSRYDVCHILCIQTMLGDDWKKTAISFREGVIEKKPYYNKMFDMKRYEDGRIRHAKYTDITSEIKSYLEKHTKNLVHINLQELIDENEVICV